MCAPRQRFFIDFKRAKAILRAYRYFGLEEETMRIFVGVFLFSLAIVPNVQSHFNGDVYTKQQVKELYNNCNRLRIGRGRWCFTYGTGALIEYLSSQDEDVHLVVSSIYKACNAMSDEGLEYSCYKMRFKGLLENWDNIFSSNADTLGRE